MDPDGLALLGARIEPALRRFLDREAPRVPRADVLREALFGLHGEPIGRSEARSIRAALGARRRQRRLVGIVDLATRELLRDPELESAEREAVEHLLESEIARLPHRVGDRLRPRYDLGSGARQPASGRGRGSRREVTEAVISLVRALIARLIEHEEHERLGN